MSWGSSFPSPLPACNEVLAPSRMFYSRTKTWTLGARGEQVLPMQALITNVNVEASWQGCARQ